MVTLLQNTRRRSEQVVVQEKLDAIADGLSDPMKHFASDEPDRVANKGLSSYIEDLRAAMGVEEEM